MTRSGTPRSPGIAFFDMDRTLVAANTGRLYAQLLRRRGRLTLRQTAHIVALLVRYRLSLVDLDDVSARAIRKMAGTPEAPLEAECRELYDESIRSLVYEEALNLLNEHRSRGDLIVILSASTPYLVRPLAADLGVDGYLCTSPTVADGLFTGEYSPPICYGAGKVVWARRFCEEHGRTLEGSTFYTDSYSDLPLLLAVGSPRIVNPDLRLLVAARLRGWPVFRFRRKTSAVAVGQNLVKETESCR